MTMGFCCCPSCTVTVLEGWGGKNYTFWQTYYKQALIVLDLSTAPAGCITGTWVLKCTAASGTSLTFQRWRNDDGLDVEITVKPDGSGNPKVSYVHVWNGTNDVVIDKSTGSWVLTDDCNQEAPCNRIFQITGRHAIAVRPLSDWPITYTVTNSSPTCTNKYRCDPFGLPNLDCPGNASFLNSMTMVSTTAGTFHDGLGIPGNVTKPNVFNSLCQANDGGKVDVFWLGPGSPWEFAEKIGTQGNACCDSDPCAPGTSRSGCRILYTGEKSLTTDPSIDCFAPLSVDVPVSGSLFATYTGTVNISIP